VWIVGLSRVLSYESVTEAIARFITDVRMHETGGMKVIGQHDQPFQAARYGFT